MKIIRTIADCFTTLYSPYWCRSTCNNMLERTNLFLPNDCWVFGNRCCLCTWFTVFPPQVLLPPNGQPPTYGLPPGQSFPAMMPPMGHALPGQPLPGSTVPSGFPGVFPPHTAAQQQQVRIVQMICSCTFFRWKIHFCLVRWEIKMYDL